MLTLLVVAILFDVIILALGVVFLRSGIRDLFHEMTIVHRNKNIIALSIIEILGGLVVLYLAGNLIFHVYLIWVTL